MDFTSESVTSNGPDFWTWLEFLLLKKSNYFGWVLGESPLGCVCVYKVMFVSNYDIYKIVK